jgi:uncharacterized membrane protein
MNPSPSKSHPQEDEKASPAFEGEARRFEGEPQPAPPKGTALVPSGDGRNAQRRPVTEALPENVAAMLAYLFGWVGGLVFLLIDRRPFVRFHAAQSVAVFATLNILLLALGGFFLGAILHGGSAAVLLVLRRLLELTWLVATVVLVLKAAGGEWFRAGRMASHYGDEAAHGMR